MASVRVLYHDNCFDGASSAALFTAFYRSCVDKKAEIEYLGLNHGPGDVFAGAFRSDPSWEHACVDFRYSSNPRLTWWFDHHQSAFINAEEQTYFYQHPNEKHFYDPTARSCSKFLAEKCQQVYQFDTKPYEELIYWADIIDGAQFSTPQMAVELKEPALKLMTWVEANYKVELKKKFIQDLQKYSLEEILHFPYVEKALTPLLKEHDRNVEVMKKRMQFQKGVVFFDVTADQLRAPNKFIPYHVYPECHYVVGISKSMGKVKISVGSNPWSKKPRTVNIADLCARYGGGGHPVVGAASLAENQIEQARLYYQEIISYLQEATAQE